MHEWNQSCSDFEHFLWLQLAQLLLAIHRWTLLCRSLRSFWKCLDARKLTLSQDESVWQAGWMERHISAYEFCVATCSTSKRGEIHPGSSPQIREWAQRLYVSLMGESTLSPDYLYYKRKGRLYKCYDMNILTGVCWIYRTPYDIFQIRCWTSRIIWVCTGLDSQLIIFARSCQPQIHHQMITANEINYISSHNASWYLRHWMRL